MTISPLLNQFQGGQMTDLPSYPGGNDPTALFEVVSPGNEEEGVNYSITAAEMAVLIGVAAYSNTVIISGPYNSINTDTRILVNRAVTVPLSVVLLAGEAYGQPILVKDVAGDASPSDPITVTFTGGELMDGLASVVIDAPYGFFWFNPVTGGFYGT